MISRLLVASDLSTRAARAVDRGLEIGGRFNAALKVLSVIDEDLPLPIRDRRVAETDDVLHQTLKDRPAPPDVTIRVDTGTDHATIVEHASAWPADMIMLGTHRDRPVLDLFVGTTVERVLRRGDRPVLVVKNPTVGPYQRVLVAVDFSVYSRRALRFAVDLAPAAEVRAIHAYDLPFSGQAGPIAAVERAQWLSTEILEQLEALVTATVGPDRVECALRIGEVMPVITQEVAAWTPDLLVVGTHGRTGAPHALLGSVAERCLKDPQTDILAVQAW